MKYKDFLPEVLTVTQFIEVMDAALNSFDGIMVEGEVDEFRITQGKWIRMVLKDERSNVRCFMPAWDLHAAIEEGMKVRVSGRPKMTEKWGFSFNLYDVKPAGEGALKRALELLKQRLEAQGLFAAERKRVLPRFPRHIALITSREAAAYTDFLKVLKARQGGLTISFINSQVQGEDAPRQLVEALELANTAGDGPDVVILVRGGGSLEDLMAFNDERVVRAVAASRTPIIVGIGHERDVTLAELAADVRASTPSNAAELAVETREAVAMELKQFMDAMGQGLADEILGQERKVRHLVEAMQTSIEAVGQKMRLKTERLVLIANRIEQTLLLFRERTAKAQAYLPKAIAGQLKADGDKLQQLARVINSYSPQAVLKRGYSITKTSGGKIIRSNSQAARGAEISTRLADGELFSVVK